MASPGKQWSGDAHGPPTKTAFSTSILLLHGQLDTPPALHVMDANLSNTFGASRDRLSPALSFRSHDVLVQTFQGWKELLCPRSRHIKFRGSPHRSHAMPPANITHYLATLDLRLSTKPSTAKRNVFYLIN